MCAIVGPLIKHSRIVRVQACRYIHPALLCVHVYIHDYIIHGRVEHKSYTSYNVGAYSLILHMLQGGSSLWVYVWLCPRWGTKEGGSWHRGQYHTCCHGYAPSWCNPCFPKSRPSWNNITRNIYLCVNWEATLGQLSLLILDVYNRIF